MTTQRWFVGLVTIFAMTASISSVRGADPMYYGSGANSQAYYGAYGQGNTTGFNGNNLGGGFNAPGAGYSGRLGQGSTGGYNARGERLNGGYQVDGTNNSGYGTAPASAAANFYGSGTGFYGNTTGYPNNNNGYGNGYSSYAGGYNGYNWYGVKNGNYQGYGVGDASYVNQINGYNGYDWYGLRNGAYSGYGGGSLNVGSAAWQPGNYAPWQPGSYLSTNQPNPAIMQIPSGRRF